jgi:hypothetical protein
MSGYLLEIASRPDGGSLSQDGWEELGYAVVELIQDYFDEALQAPAEEEVADAIEELIEVDCDAAAAGGLSLVFTEQWSLGAACGYHWYVHGLAARWDEVAALFAQRGQRLVGPKPDAAAEYGPRRSYAFAAVGDAMLAVHPNGEAIIDRGTGEDQVVRYDDPDLGDALREVAATLYATGLCRCTFCVRLRPADVDGVPPADRLA